MLLEFSGKCLESTVVGGMCDDQRYSVPRERSRNAEAGETVYRRRHEFGGCASECSAQAKVHAQCGQTMSALQQRGVRTIDLGFGREIFLG